MLRRQLPIAGALASFTQVRDLEGAVSAFHEPLNARLHLAQLIRRGAETRHALLEEREGALEIDVLRFQLAHDLLEPAEPLLEAHDDFRMSVARAATTPSRSTRSNSMSGAKASALVSARPAWSRATAYPRWSVASGLNAFRLPPNAPRRARRRSMPRVARFLSAAAHHCSSDLAPSTRLSSPRRSRDWIARSSAASSASSRKIGRASCRERGSV